MQLFAKFDPPRVICQVPVPEVDGIAPPFTGATCAVNVNEVPRAVEETFGVTVIIGAPCETEVLVNDGVVATAR